MLQIAAAVLFSLAVLGPGDEVSDAEIRQEERAGTPADSDELPADDNADVGGLTVREIKELFPSIDVFRTLFREHSISYSGRGYVDEAFTYQIFIPPALTPDERLPLIVWMHGRGEANGPRKARFHLRYLKQLFKMSSESEGAQRFALMAMQCPQDNAGWTTSAANADDMADVLAAAIDDVLTRYPIDPSRVTLAGISSGGNGVWTLGSRRPELFAALVPMASTGLEGPSIEKLAGVPVWAFHNTNDAACPPGFVRRTIAALQGYGGRAHLTEFPASVHDCWTPAFEKCELLTWMLSQQRGTRTGRAPGSMSLSASVRMVGYRIAAYGPARLAGLCGLVTVAIVAVLAVRRRQRAAAIQTFGR